MFCFVFFLFLVIGEAKDQLNYLCDQINEVSFELRMETLSVIVNDLRSSATLLGLTDPHNDHLPVGLIAELVEHCTGIAEVRARVPFKPVFCYRLKGL